ELAESVGVLPRRAVPALPFGDASLQPLDRLGNLAPFREELAEHLVELRFDRMVRRRAEYRGLERAELALRRVDLIEPSEHCGAADPGPNRLRMIGSVPRGGALDRLAIECVGSGEAAHLLADDAEGGEQLGLD